MHAESAENLPFHNYPPLLKLAKFITSLLQEQKKISYIFFYAHSVLKSKIALKYVKANLHFC